MSSCCVDEMKYGLNAGEQKVWSRTLLCLTLEKAKYVVRLQSIPELHRSEADFWGTDVLEDKNDIITSIYLLIYHNARLSP